MAGLEKMPLAAHCRTQLPQWGWQTRQRRLAGTCI